MSPRAAAAFVTAVHRCAQPVRRATGTGHESVRRGRSRPAPPEHLAGDAGRLRRLPAGRRPAPRPGRRAHAVAPGKPIRDSRDGLEIAAFVDGVEGPIVETRAGLTRLVHGGDAGPARRPSAPPATVRGRGMGRPVPARQPRSDRARPALLPRVPGRHLARHRGAATGRPGDARPRPGGPRGAGRLRAAGRSGPAGRASTGCSPDPRSRSAPTSGSPRSATGSRPS